MHASNSPQLVTLPSLHTYVGTLDMSLHHMMLNNPYGSTDLAKLIMRHHHVTSLPFPTHISFSISVQGPHAPYRQRWNVHPKVRPTTIFGNNAIAYSYGFCRLHPFFVLVDVTLLKYPWEYILQRWFNQPKRINYWFEAGCNHGKVDPKNASIS